MHMRLPLLVVLLGGLLVGCGAPAAPGPAPTGEVAVATGALTTTGEPVLITFGASAYTHGAYQLLIDEFNQANPDVQVQLVNLDKATEGGDQSIPWARRLAGAADTYTMWGGSLGGIDQGLVRDLAPFIAADGGFGQDDFYPGAIEYDRLGRVTMLPTTIRLPLLMYNRALWDERGVPRPTADWTWADLRAAAEQLARRDGDRIETYGLMLATRADLVGTADLHSLGALLEAQRGETVNLTSPPFVTAVEEIVQLVRDGVVYTPPEYADGSFLSSMDYMPLISAGRIGMWRSAHFQPSSRETVDYETGLAPVPPSPRQWQSASREGLAMSAGTRYPDQAWRWLAFLSRQDPNIGENQVEQIPARRSLAEARELWSTLDEEGRAAIDAVLAQLAAGPPPSEERRNSASWAIPNAVTEAVKAVLDKDETPEAALAAAQAGLDQALAAFAQPTATAGATPAPVVVATPAPAATAAADAAQITFVTTGIGNDRLRELAGQFNQQFPQYFVTIRDFAWPQDGTRVNIGDVVSGGDCAYAWGGHNEADREQLLDLRPLLDADQTFPQDDIPTALLADYEHEGRLYGLPDSVSFRVLRYNKDLFDAAGMAYPDSTWTIDDMFAAAERLNTAEGAEGSYGFVPQSGWDLFIYLDLMGVELVRGAGQEARPNFSDPALATAITGYFDLLRATSPATGITGYDRDQQDSSYTLIDGGRAALWFTMGFDEAHGGFTPATFERGYAPVPIGNGPRHTEFFTRGLYISAESASPEACWAWLRFLLDAPGSRGEGFPARVSLAESPTFLASAPEGAAALYAAMKPALLAGPPQGLELYEADMSTYWLQRAADRAFQGGDLAQELIDAQFLTEQYQACVRGGEKPEVCTKQVDPTYGGW